VTAGLAIKLNERRREVKPNLEVIVECSIVGEPGCEGLPLGLKKDGVLEGRVEGALKTTKNRTIRIVAEESGREVEIPAPTLEEV